MHTLLRTAAFATLIIAALAAPASAQQDPQRALSQIAGDVYRFQNNFHFSIVTVTDEGVVVTDPINLEAAEWLKAEIAKLTDKPIVRLIYSHSHADHASGGAVFADTATVIAHANAPAAIDGVTPDIRFDDEMNFALGGKTFELTYLGPGHGEDLIAMVVRPENVAFIVDAVSAKRLPFRDFPNSNVDHWTDQVRKAETLKFDILAPGHGGLGDMADVVDGRVYLETLRAEVLSGMKAGQSIDDLAQSVTMDKYKDWQSYDDWRELNVRGMARSLIETGAAK